MESHCTVRAVFCQPGFGETVSDVVEWVMESNLVGVFCKTGYHRAATVGAATAALLNFTGHNCLHLSLAAELPGDIFHSVEVAYKWLDTPWADPQVGMWTSLKAKTMTRPEAWNTACTLEVSRYTFNISLLVLVEF